MMMIVARREKKKGQRMHNWIRPLSPGWLDRHSLCWQRPQRGRFWRSHRLISRLFSSIITQTQKGALCMLSLSTFYRSKTHSPTNVSASPLSLFFALLTMVESSEFLLHLYPKKWPWVTFRRSSPLVTVLMQELQLERKKKIKMMN